MKRAIKWISIVLGALLVLVIAIVLIVPMVVDVEKYKPEIEKRVTEATGRPFSIGGELRLSLFPWVGLAFSDLRLGNPAGFEEKDFLLVKSFDVQVKLIPLLSKNIQVKRFILEGPRIVLEKRKDGRGNWEGLGRRPQGEVQEEKKKKRVSEREERDPVPFGTLVVGEFAVTKGSFLWLDQGKGERREVTDLAFRLQDVSFDRPVRITLSALLDGLPISLEGQVGPLGEDPGKGAIPFDLTLKAFEELQMGLKGELVDAATNPRFDLALEVSPFSPRKLVAALGQAFPVATSDPGAMSRVALKAEMKGDLQNISISDGMLTLDDSTLAFSLDAKDFSKPEIKFDLNLDQIDIDRYLPPKSEEKPAEPEKKPGPSSREKKKTDYTPLRKLVLDGTIRVGTLKAQGAKLEDLHLKVVGRDGLFRMDPFSVKLYRGALTAKGSLDVRKDTPKSQVELQAKGIQAGPLLRDLLKKDFLEGAFRATVAISMAGDDPDKIKRSLNGKGEFLFKDGAIKGIDLAGMARNVKAAFGLAEKGGEKPKTDFSELHIPFSIKTGVVSTPKTRLLSPFLRVQAVGNADLVKESLDFRVALKFVGTLKGQGDRAQRSGIMVPVLVGGTFSSPSFRPDLKGMLKQRFEKELFQAPGLKDLFKAPSQKKEDQKTMEDTMKGLLKGLPFGK